LITDWRRGDGCWRRPVEHRSPSSFRDDAGRNAHLAGRIAAALMANATELLAQPPRIEQVDVLAVKLPKCEIGTPGRFRAMRFGNAWKFVRDQLITS
jgi:hypothetical protein